MYIPSKLPTSPNTEGDLSTSASSAPGDSEAPEVPMDMQLMQLDGEEMDDHELRELEREVEGELAKLGVGDECETPTTIPPQAAAAATAPVTVHPASLHHPAHAVAVGSNPHPSQAPPPKTEAPAPPTTLVTAPMAAPKTEAPAPPTTLVTAPMAAPKTEAPAPPTTLVTAPMAAPKTEAPAPPTTLVTAPMAAPQTEAPAPPTTLVTAPMAAPQTEAPAPPTTLVTAPMAAPKTEAPAPPTTLVTTAAPKTEAPAPPTSLATRPKTDSPAACGNLAMALLDNRSPLTPSMLYSPDLEKRVHEMLSKLDDEQFDERLKSVKLYHPYTTRVTTRLLMFQLEVIIYPHTLLGICLWNVC